MEESSGTGSRKDPSMTDVDTLAEFWKWFSTTYDGGLPMNPDAEDFEAVRREHPTPATTEAEVARRYKLAQAAKLARIFRTWKSMGPASQE